jgi:hypothetical protein
VEGDVPVQIFGDDPVQAVVPELLHDDLSLLDHFEAVLGVVGEEGRGSVVRKIILGSGKVILRRSSGWLALQS